MVPENLLKDAHGGSALYKKFPSFLLLMDLLTSKRTPNPSI